MRERRKIVSTGNPSRPKVTLRLLLAGWFLKHGLIMTEQQAEAIRQLLAVGKDLARECSHFVALYPSASTSRIIADWHSARGVWESVRGQRECRTRGCLGLCHGHYDMCPQCRTDEVTRCQ